jgi:4-hydroxy-tetrahydrodipicolinate synthase
MIPAIFKLIQEGSYDAATDAFWRIHPARRAKGALAQQLHGGAFINRQAWKFQAWLQGYNGGPLRQPTQRVHDGQMNALRKGLIDSGMTPTELPNADFFTGRNP